MYLWFMQGGPTSEQWGTTLLGRAAGILDVEVCVPGVSEGIPMRSSESPSGLIHLSFIQIRKSNLMSKSLPTSKENLRIWQGWVFLQFLLGACTVP